MQHRIYPCQRKQGHHEVSAISHLGVRGAAADASPSPPSAVKDVSSSLLGARRREPNAGDVAARAALGVAFFPEHALPVELDRLAQDASDAGEALVLLLLPGTLLIEASQVHVGMAAVRATATTDKAGGGSGTMAEASMGQLTQECEAGEL